MVLRGAVEHAEPVAGGGRVEVKLRGSNRLGDHVTAQVELELPAASAGGGGR
jgi:hypothetical protein